MGGERVEKWEANNYRVAVILPMYNEENSIAALRAMFDDNPALLPGYDCRIIVVDDGSKDGTSELVTRWALQNPRVTVISHLQNMGLGQAVLTGFGEAICMGVACAITMDADASHTEKVINQMVRALQEGADIVIASRFVKGSKQIGVTGGRQILSWGARLLLKMVFNLRGVTDYTINFRAYRTELLKDALVRSQRPFLVLRSFAAVVELLLKLAPLAGKIDEVPLVLRYDFKKSRSKLRIMATILDYIRLCLMPREKGVLGKGLKIL